ncbi:hypothetical protein EDD66_10817 [Mobilisporobacter senegalensis]|uniref:Uncharacterized protein n=1 Tax=Mobilisporobacter senegalensis TaxID=1329262 RepID=A0A3N1XI15_9FIRM|nr:hypothetical protein [Mobilisporobacter senegalensis]ROR26295.1 hypothetical protein EDD66_10817 [Mobilisporobacter senegalensis]
MQSKDTYELIGVISGIVAIIATYFNNGYKKNEKMAEDYFELLLVPYVCDYKNNNTLNAVKYIKKNYTQKCYFIPKYIFYLVKYNKKVELHKILMVDYIWSYPTGNNIMSNILDKMYRIVSFIQSFACIFGGLFIVFKVLIIIETLISGTVNDFTLPDLLLGFILIILFFTLIKHSFQSIEDNYSLSKKQIEKNVKKKLKKYDKDYNKYYV